jgi:ferritin-like metal-binding protein YciE
MLGHNDVAKILETTLREEKQTDQTPTKLAESIINEETTAE